MRKIQYILLLIPLISLLQPCTTTVIGQEIRSKAEFAPPLDIPLILAGNFGEIRSNHFHSGLDFKTNGQSGYPVYSVEDGYITRIKVQAGGYGNSLYIRHKNGYTSQYGHLLQFRSDIQDFVKAKQYKDEEFTVDIFLNARTFQVKKGEMIALSGNSGSSQAPHLHFEIRDPQTDNPMNPLAFNFKVKDKTPPVLESVVLYSLSERKELKPAKTIPLTGSKGSYKPVTNKVYPVDQVAGIGINATDYLDEANNPCGVYTIELLIDRELHSRIKMDEFSFSESKYINSFIDFKQFQQTRDHVLKTFVEPNNHLSIYEFVKNRGKITLTDDQIHEVLIRVTDVHGNLSETQLNIRLDPSAYAYDFSQAFYSAFFNYAETNRFEEDGVRIYIGPNTLYDDLYFKYSREEAMGKYYSAIHRIHQPDVPLHRDMTIWIQPTDLPDQLRSKALIARLNPNGRLSAMGGTWDNGMLKTNTSSFGSFVITVDTSEPTITPLNLPAGEVSAIGNDIRFIIRDDFSGIRTYRATVDGNWILFEYDPKTATIRHQTDPLVIPAGKVMQLKIVVTDGVGNKKEYAQKIIRK